MKQGIYLPPDANEALLKTQSWQTDVVAVKLLLAVELLMAGEAIPLELVLYCVA